MIHVVLSEILSNQPLFPIGLKPKKSAE